MFTLIQVLFKCFLKKNVYFRTEVCFSQLLHVFCCMSIFFNRKELMNFNFYATTKIKINITILFIMMHLNENRD